MRCPHCYRTLHTYESINAVGLVMRVRDCHTCKKRYRTEEKPIEEMELLSVRQQQKLSPGKRRAERELWHEERRPALQSRDNEKAK